MKNKVNLDLYRGNGNSFEEYYNSIEEQLGYAASHIKDDVIRGIYDLNINNGGCMHLLLAHHRQEMMDKHLLWVESLNLNLE